MSGFIYLASPYTSPNKDIMELRYWAVMDKVNQMLKKKQWVYSPIVHCHNIAATYGHTGDFAYWQEYDFTMIDAARELHVLMLDGWQMSNGVREETAYALNKGKIVHYVEEFE